MKGDDLTPRQFVESLLPAHYGVTEMTTGHLWCESNYGIHDADYWDKFMKSVKKYFGDTFKEVYYLNKKLHKVFVISYDYYKLNNIDMYHKLLPKL